MTTNSRLAMEKGKERESGIEGGDTKHASSIFRIFQVDICIAI